MAAQWNMTELGISYSLWLFLVLHIADQDSKQFVETPEKGRATWLWPNNGAHTDSLRSQLTPNVGKTREGG